ncbi:hypothetical protein DFH09DRAFT_1153704 [Mycena vulgaris]|nr:hypothetical protein DFH09DRAFT_1153704 [Mycena vulgaris]
MAECTLHALFPDLVYDLCPAIAVCLTPTDPIICATIVGASSMPRPGDLHLWLSGKYALKHVPRNLRLIISAESAANDGLAYPFLSTAIYLTAESSRRAAIGKWFLFGWLCASPSSLSSDLPLGTPHRIEVSSGSSWGGY